MNAKKKFFVAYDFGAGDNWRIFYAKSKDDIAQRFPELVVHDYERPPEWMSKEIVSQIEAIGVLDIDELK